MRQIIIFIAVLSFGLVFGQACGGLTSINYNGHTYELVEIGSQCWFKENLKTTTYSDGTPIDYPVSNAVWKINTTGAYAWYNGDSATYDSSYGKLYNWYAVGNSAGLCPTGWHVPSDAEWTALGSYLEANGYNYDGSTTGNKYAKAMADTVGWNIQTGVGVVGNTDYPTYRNKSGFSALPGGYRSTLGYYKRIGINGYWWSSTTPNSYDAWYRSLSDYYSSVYRSNWHKYHGASVRCLKDTGAIQTPINQCDTLSNFSKTNSLAFYSYTGGYISGHNDYGDIAKADRFSVINGSQLEKVELNLWGYDATGSSTVNINVWEESGGQPSNIIATKSISISSFSSNTNGTQKTMIQFISPVIISGDFYVGIELDYSNGDTVVLFTNTDGESNPGTAWEKWSDGTWYPYSSSSAWSMNLSHDITIYTCPVVTNVNKQYSNDNFRIYPNPFTTSTKMELPSEPHTLTIYDIVGNKVREEQVSGTTSIERGDLTKGMYLIEVRSDNQTYSGKLVVE